MSKKLTSKMVKGLNELTDVRFVVGFLTGAGTIAIVLANAVGLF